MFKIKILISVITFSLLIIGTSIIKNETREIEKKIFTLSKITNQKERDLNESQLDFFYLTSPAIIEKRIKHLDSIEYFTMEYSKIFLSIADFKNIHNKFVNQRSKNEQKIKKK